MREFRQNEITNFILNCEFTIINCAPRVGKCKITIDYLKIKGYSKILVVYPNIAIRKSWQDEVIKWKFKSKIKYTTTAGLKKINESYDVIIADEIHQYSPLQLFHLDRIINLQTVKRCIGLTGTLTTKSETEIYLATKLRVGCRYSIDQAIKEGIITDYKITVVMTELNNSIYYLPFNKNRRNPLQTEKMKYDYYTAQINRCIEEGRDLGLLPIIRMQIFKNSIAKRNLTKLLIDKYREQRLLIFCGTTAIADTLRTPVYHSKKNDFKIKDDFCSGKFNHLAVCKMLNAGVTVLPINKSIINSFDSNSENLAQQINRLTNFEYDNPDKVAEVFIVCTDTAAEKKWLNKALSLFDPSKITYKKFEEL